MPCHNFKVNDSESPERLSWVKYVLVALAYVNLGLTRPASAYTKTGPVGVSVVGVILTLVVLDVCASNWENHRLLAILGFIASFLWMVMTFLPVL